MNSFIFQQLETYQRRSLAAIVRAHIYNRMESSLDRICKKCLVLLIIFILSNVAIAQRANNAGIELEKPINNDNETIKDTTLLQDILIELDFGKMGYLGVNQNEQFIFPEQWSVGTGITYQGSPYVEFGGIISYHHLIYDSYEDPNMESYYPNFIVTSAKPDGSGRIIEASAKFRIFFSASDITQPYLFFQGGHYWTFFPGMTYTSLENNVEQIYYKPSSKESTSFYGGGFGLKFHINKSIALDPEVNVSIGEVFYVGLKIVVQCKI